MDCSEALKLVEKYIDGELSGLVLERFEEHKGVCRVCTSKIEALKELEGLMDLLPEEIPPEGLTESIIEGAKFTGFKKVRTRSPLVALARIAAVLLIAVIGLYLGARLAMTRTRTQTETASTSLPEVGAFNLVPPDSPGAACLTLYEGPSNGQK